MGEINETKIQRAFTSLRNETSNDESFTELMLSPKGLEMAKQFCQKPIRRYKSVVELEVLDVMCAMFLEAAKENNGKLPSSMVFKEMPNQNTTMTPKAYLTAMAFQEGKEKKLKAKKLLDYVHEQLKEKYRFFKSIIAIHETT